MDNELFELLPLSGGKFAKVDKLTFKHGSVLSWSLTADGYPATNYNGKRMYLHDFVFGAVKNAGEITDHISGDKLDNRFSNLRKVTKQQNNMNRSANKVRKDTHYKGVILHESGKWQARIGIDGKKVYLGYFKSPEDAARAYNDAALKHHGEYAKLNDLDIELAELKYKVEQVTGWNLKQPDLTSYLLEKLPENVDVKKAGPSLYFAIFTGGTFVSDTPLKSLLKLTLALREAGEL